jgi:lipopolysaccharide export system protein LptC
MHAQKKILLTGLVIGSALLTGLVVHGYFKYREIKKNPAKLIEAIPQGTNIVLGEVRHTAVRDGKKEWILEASSAHYSENTREAVFTDVRVTFFIENGEAVNLEGEKGTIDTASNDMQVTGHVRVAKGDYTLLTENIEYDHTTRHITSLSPVRILSRSLELRADSMQVDLAQETAVFTGAVEGQINAANPLRM